MEEVIKLEGIIREALPRLRGRLSIEANEIMAGRPTVGTRLEALRDIAGRIK